MTFWAKLIFISWVFIQVVQFGASDFSPLKYCSFDNDEYIKDRAIPKIAKPNPKKVLSVKQVHVLHRHGSRVPDSPTSVSCLPSMKDNPIKWDCNYNDIILGDSTTSKSLTENKTNGQSDTDNSNDYNQTTKSVQNNNTNPIFFTKKYDANVDRNDLYGNCMLGQLTSAAIPQMKHIANSIHYSYFEESPLFTMKDFQENHNLLYFRSTDKQRTIHSGSLIISHLLNKLIYDDADYSENPPQIPPLNLHLVDLANDELRVNDITCPAFKSILERSMNSPEAMDIYNKNKKFYDEWSAVSNLKFKSFYKSHILDCYTSALCSDNQQYLPEILRVNETDYENSFAASFYEAYSEEYNFIYNWNNSELAKCSARDLVKTFFQAFNAGNENTLDYTPSRESKLLIYSAHDTTLLFFMSALDKIFDGMWPPLASMLLFELSEDNEGSHYFRVIYNGEDVTHKWKGCNQSKTFHDDGVCPFKYIIDQIQWIHTIPQVNKENMTAKDSNSFFYTFLFIFIVAAIFSTYFALRSFTKLVPMDKNEKLHLLKELKEISNINNKK